MASILHPVHPFVEKTLRFTRLHSLWHLECLLFARMRRFQLPILKPLRLLIRPRSLPCPGCIRTRVATRISSRSWLMVSLAEAGASATPSALRRPRPSGDV